MLLPCPPLPIEEENASINCVLSWFNWGTILAQNMLAGESSGGGRCGTWCPGASHMPAGCQPGSETPKLRSNHVCTNSLPLPSGRRETTAVVAGPFGGNFSWWGVDKKARCVSPGPQCPMPWTSLRQMPREERQGWPPVLAPCCGCQPGCPPPGFRLRRTLEEY